MVKLTLFWIACWRPGQAISAQKTHPQSEWNDLKRPPKSSVSEWMRKRGWSESEGQSSGYSGKRLKIRPDHGAGVVVGGGHVPPENMGKPCTGRRPADFPVAKDMRGAQSATTKHTSRNSEQDGSKVTCFRENRRAGCWETGTSGSEGRAVKPGTVMC